MCTDLTGRGSDSMENTQNAPKRSGGKISYTLQAIGLIPLLTLGIVMLFFTSQWFTKIMYQEVERELYDATKSATTLLNAAYPGDYRLEGDVAYLLYKGDVDITREYSLFDQFKEDTGLDITLFYQDTRILTTLYNTQGDRIVGSGAPDVVIRDVLNTGEDHFYINTLINGKTYFSYYSPVRNQDGSIVGMLFIGKSSAAVSQSIQRYVYPLTWLIIGFVAYYRRYLPYFQKVKEIIESGTIGNVVNVQVRFSVPPRDLDFQSGKEMPWRLQPDIAGGGYFYDLAPHQIDLLQNLFGVITRAHGYPANRAHLYQAEDTLSACFFFESGIPGSGSWCFVGHESAKEDCIEVIGEKGSLSFSVFTYQPIEVITSEGKNSITVPNPPYVQLPLIKSVIEHLQGIGKCDCTSVSATAVNWVLDRVLWKN